MSDKCTHTEHCCVKHGCKYGEEDCPVILNDKAQSHPCELCEDDIDDGKITDYKTEIPPKNLEGLLILSITRDCDNTVNLTLKNPTNGEVQVVVIDTEPIGYGLYTPIFFPPEDYLTLSRYEQCQDLIT